MSFTKRDLSLWQFAGYAVTALGGTLLHFLHDWTNQNILIAPFSGVNESTWEHMKLLFFSLFIFALIQSRFFKDYKNFWCVKLAGIVTGLVLIPVLFYTYNGVFGKSPDWINIAIFYVSAGLVFLYERRWFPKLSCKHPRLALTAICLMASGVRHLNRNSLAVGLQDG